MAVFAHGWRPIRSYWLRVWPGWRSRLLATIPQGDPAASQPRATRPLSSNTQTRDQLEPSLSGEREAGSLDFDSFFQRYQRPLYTYLRRLLPTEESAIDITQEVFFRAWSHFEQVRAFGRPESWLFRVATNLAVSQLRRREPVQLSQLLRHTSDGQASEGERLLPEGAPDLAEAVAERDIVTRSLLVLPERQRAALLLRAAYGCSVEEVAEALGLSVVNTPQLLSRGGAFVSCTTPLNMRVKDKREFAPCSLGCQEMDGSRV
jgi:RNA polymerase sigma-70 factor (ECF subfamily)